MTEDRQRLIELARRVSRIQKAWGNETCADCHAAGPNWTSRLRFPVDDRSLVVLLCEDCAVLHHMHLGSKRCFIKYLSYVHEWSHPELDLLESSGNSLVNSVYEANLSTCDYHIYYGYSNLTSSPEDQEERQMRFIKRKYKRRQFLDAEALEVALDKVHSRVIYKKAKAEAIAARQQILQRADSEKSIHNLMQINELDDDLDNPSIANRTTKRLHSSTGDLTPSRFGIRSMGITSVANPMRTLSTNSSLNPIITGALPGGSLRGETRRRLPSSTGLTLSTSLRGIAGEAKTNNQNKSIAFVDLGMLMLDDAEILDEQPLGYSDDESLGSITKALTEESASAICSVSMASIVTGTTVESWSSEDDLLDWMAATSSLTPQEPQRKPEPVPQSTSKNYKYGRRSSSTSKTARKKAGKRASPSSSKDGENKKTVPDPQKTALPKDELANDGRRRRASSVAGRRRGRRSTTSKTGSRARSLSNKGLRLDVASKTAAT